MSSWNKFKAIVKLFKLFYLIFIVNRIIQIKTLLKVEKKTSFKHNKIKSINSSIGHYTSYKKIWSIFFQIPRFDEKKEDFHLPEFCTSLFVASTFPIYDWQSKPLGKCWTNHESSSIQLYPEISCCWRNNFLWKWRLLFDPQQVKDIRCLSFELHTKWRTEG